MKLLSGKMRLRRLDLSGSFLSHVDPFGEKTKTSCLLQWIIFSINLFFCQFLQQLWTNWRWSTLLILSSQMNNWHTFCNRYICRQKECICFFKEVLMHVVTMYIVQCTVYIVHTTQCTFTMFTHVYVVFRFYKKPDSKSCTWEISLLPIHLKMEPSLKMKNLNWSFKHLIR